MSHSQRKSCNYSNEILNQEMERKIGSPKKIKIINKKDNFSLNLKKIATFFQQNDIINLSEAVIIGFE